ncbi:sucrose-6-phosphate hydrolase [Jeotgalibacillus sp. S-D1]|uniref:sucrose-6-phosphate hydrolase n=1 Tax=Jeotgalibacillus sp. S-D1 TaxID=2552189 RepID=UPI001059C3EA|nr:sucrose-6-phosphate hydrolase [Jeotgalibacillus sp. S-D1]TDL32656.1 sucrose-6-phosphate hydrolase [Jeotgalibacillus sp. S-D1]
MNRNEELKQQAYSAVKKQSSTVRLDPYFPAYHLAPPAGLLNDPNGWIQWKGIYHLFFQWMPFDTAHGAKFWGHFSSENLTDWTLEPIALTPSDWFDKNGCYSGSAIGSDDKLTLFYTGNVKNEQNQRESYQCVAESTDGRTFEKKGVKVELPEGFTAHFRDPKVWQHKDNWYMVIGAQTKEETGSVAFLESNDLEKWTYRGILSHANQEPFHDFGYMWECPDLFELGGKDILLFSPQGIASDGIQYNNEYQSGYAIGKLNYDSAQFTHEDFVELDRGFEFYAPQTTLDDKGRRILVGWMGVPDQNEFKQPTVKEGWLHQMTLPRELKLIDGTIFQIPLEEMKELRTTQTIKESGKQQHTASISRASEVQVDGKIQKLTLFDNMTLQFNEQSKLLTLERPSYADGQTERRSCLLPNGLYSLQLFIDHSSVEIFVNQGEAVFTSRMFADEGVSTLFAEGYEELQITAWTLRNDAVNMKNEYSAEG